jgi:3-phenylpropionate/cinnamic acid dioxygenase small subunit
MGTPALRPYPMNEERLHAEIYQFYARQMQAMDRGDAHGWAATFTSDGVFAANAFPNPVRGRTALAAAAGKAAEESARDGVVRRHWLGMLAIDPQDDGTVGVRCYALVFATRRGGVPELSRSTVCEDILVAGDGSWLVKERRVTRDDL